MAKILVVEEDAGVRKIVVDVLSANPGCEYEIFEANDGAVGLELIKDMNFDLVITDWRMREMDGDKMIAVARESGCMPARIIVITGGDLTECWHRFSAFLLPGLKIYLGSLPKPFELGSLLEAVTRALAWQPSS